MGCFSKMMRVKKTPALEDVNYKEKSTSKLLLSLEKLTGRYYTYFGYGDVPSGRVSIFTILV